MPPITLVATKAPSAMNTPWPKFSTSIRPKISVRPEAMMKMISPIASPATVSVTQVEDEPISGQAASSTAPSSAIGRQSNSALGMATAGAAAAGAVVVLALIDALPATGPAAAAAALRPRPVRAIAPACTTRPLSITATRSPSALAIWKFCSTSRMVVLCAFSWRKASIRLLMIDGARPLLGSSISSSSRGSTMARATASICFCPPDSLPAG